MKATSRTVSLSFWTIVINQSHTIIVPSTQSKLKSHMLNLWLITCFVIASLGGTAGIGDDYERKGARPQRKTPDDPLKGLSMEAWHDMSRVALVLYVDNAHLAHGTDSEMAEALYHHYQNVVESENTPTTASSPGPSHAPTLLEQPSQKKKKQAKPN